MTIAHCSAMAHGHLLEDDFKDKTIPPPDELIHLPCNHFIAGILSGFIQIQDCLEAKVTIFPCKQVKAHLTL